MDIEQLKDLITKHKELEDLVIHKIEFMSMIDDWYGIYDRIDKIYFDSTIVNILNSNNFASNITRFPIEWLIIPDNELKDILLKSKQKRLEMDELKRIERNDYDLYFKLKHTIEKPVTDSN